MSSRKGVLQHCNTPPTPHPRVRRGIHLAVCCSVTRKSIPSNHPSGIQFGLQSVTLLFEQFAPALKTKPTTHRVRHPVGDNQGYFQRNQPRSNHQVRGSDCHPASFVPPTDSARGLPGIGCLPKGSLFGSAWPNHPSPSPRSWSPAGCTCTCEARITPNPSPPLLTGRLLSFRCAIHESPPWPSPLPGLIARCR